MCTGAYVVGNERNGTIDQLDDTATGSVRGNKPCGNNDKAMMVKLNAKGSKSPCSSVLFVFCVNRALGYLAEYNGTSELLFCEWPLTFQHTFRVHG